MGGAATVAFLSHSTRATDNAPQAVSPAQPWFPEAPPLPAPDGPVIEVKTVEQLLEAVDRITPGGTVLVADGVYHLPRYFEIRTDQVTLRSASGRREAVVLDGGRSRHRELLGLSNCRGVTIAGLTIRNVPANGLKINSQTNVQELTVYDCVFHNIWQRAIKSVLIPPNDLDQFRPRGSRILYSLFYNDRPKRFDDDPADTPANFGGNYIGGIDLMYATGWAIRHNAFVGIQGRSRTARGAIFIWVDSRGCQIDGNIVIDCDSGICLGNAYRHEHVETHLTGAVVSNNFISRAPMDGIFASWTRDCQILHNTIHDPQCPRRRLIRLAHQNPGLIIANNLLHGFDIQDASDTPPLLRGNRLISDRPDLFLDAERGNLRLARPTDELSGRADPAWLVPHDIDGNKRSKTSSSPGAHEPGD
jgi:hypothetical protein